MLISLAILVTLWPGSTFAQQRPLITEDPETIGAGRLLLEAGFDYGRDLFFPVSGLEGNLLRLPLLGVSIGVSSIAEVQIDGGFYNRLSITDRRPAPLSNALVIDGDTTTSVEDLVIGTKIRLIGETAGRPSFGFRFATRLPNSSNESGIGLDTTDFFASLLIGKTVRSIRVVFNGGLAILGDPTTGDRQNDVLTYGFSLARAVTQHVEFVGDINGRQDKREGNPFPGTENRSSGRLGVRYTRGAGRVDAGVIVGFTSRDPNLGFTAGVTWVFDAFKIP